MRLATAIAAAIVALCCGVPKQPPLAVPSCPGGAYEVCEQDDIGAHNCTCPEE